VLPLVSVTVKCAEPIVLVYEPNPAICAGHQSLAVAWATELSTNSCESADMGTSGDPSNGDTARPILDIAETLRCRKTTNGDTITADSEPTSPTSPLSPSKRPLTHEEIDAAIDKLPPWRDQLTLRGLIAGENTAAGQLTCSFERCCSSCLPFTHDCMERALK
jgi:hypothetical protein